MVALFHALFALVAALLAAQLVYPLLMTLAGQLFGRERLSSPPLPSTHHRPPSNHYACIITAYRNATIARPLVESLLRQTYSHLTIYLVADECADADFSFDDERFVLLRPEAPLRLKAKSIRYAMDRFAQPQAFTAVFDADNLAHPQFLEIVERYAAAGFSCIQGQRTAKNLDTVYAALDSLGEHYKNYLERYTPYRLGGSAVISGSGMVTETALYRAYLFSPAIEQGQHLGKRMLQEDKILQNFLLERDVRIAYAREALVFDEKVETAAAVETQRGRWLFSYFQNLPHAFGLLWRGLQRGSFNQMLFGWVTLVLPMFLQVGLASVLLVVAVLMGTWAWAAVLAGALCIFALNLLWTLRLSQAPPPVWRALWRAPLFVARQALGLFKMRDPDRHFQHTEHRRPVSVDEILEQHPPQR